MAREMDPFINNFCKAKVALIKAQKAAEVARLELLNACIDSRDSRFLKLDETALLHYTGHSSWQQFQDS